MKNERLLHALGQVEENYIEEAAPKGMQENQKTQTKKSNAGKYTWVKWGALAASVCIIAGISIKAAVLTEPDDEVLDSIVHQNNTVRNEETVNSNTVINQTTSDTVDTTTQEQLQANTEALPTDLGQEKQFSSTGGAALDDEGFPNWGLTLSVKDVTSTGLTLVCTQSGGEPTGSLLTGEQYKLITLVDETWKTVEELPLPEGVDGRGWHQIAYPIPMEDSREFEINWSWIYGELPEGTYRLVKEFMDFRETGDYDTFDFWVEFEIE